MRRALWSLPLASLIPMFVACSSSAADDSGANDSTESGDGDGDDEPTGDGDGDGDGDGEPTGDGDGEIGDGQYLEVGLGYLAGDTTQTRTIAVFDVTEPGSPASPTTILEIPLGNIQRSGSPDGSWAAYVVGGGNIETLYLHSYAVDPTAPAVEVEGLPVDSLTLAFAPDGSGLAVLTGASSDSGPRQLFHIPLSESDHGSPTLVHEGVEKLEGLSMSHDGRLLFFVDGEPGGPQQLFASEVGSGAPSAPVQLTELPVGELNAWVPQFVAEDLAYFEVEAGFNQGGQLMRLALADWPAFELEPVFDFNEAPRQWSQFSQDGARVLHTHGETSSPNDPATAEIIITDGGVIQDPLIFFDVPTKTASISPSGRYVGLDRFDAVPEQFEVLIVDLDGPTPESPVPLGTTRANHELSDRWIAWPGLDGRVMAASLENGVGEPIALTEAGASYLPLQMIGDQRLVYVAQDLSYWLVDLSGAVPGAPLRITHSVNPGVSVSWPWLVHSVLDDRFFYKLQNNDDSQFQLWVNDPTLDDAREGLVEWPNNIGALLYAPAYGKLVSAAMY